MIQTRHRFGLALKTLAPLRIAGELLRENLDGNRALKAGIRCAI